MLSTEKHRLFWIEKIARLLVFSCCENDDYEGKNLISSTLEKVLFEYCRSDGKKEEQKAKFEQIQICFSVSETNDLYTSDSIEFSYFFIDQLEYWRIEKLQ